MRDTFYLCGAIFVLLFALIIATNLATAQLPSDLITRVPAPGVLDLQHVSPMAVKAIDALNANLTAWQPHEVADLGHYYGYQKAVVQTLEESVSATQLNFSGEIPAIPVSIDTEVGNEGQEPVATEDSGLVYL